MASTTSLVPFVAPSAPHGCSFSNMTLVLNNTQVPFIHYTQGPKDEIWTPAKPVMRVTGEHNITQILDRVPDDCKMSFKELVDAKGVPVNGCYGFITTPNPSDYHDGKAIWVNESGFYSMLLGSRKKECALFQRWVLEEVLPSIRRTGAYRCGPERSILLSPEYVNAVALQVVELMKPEMASAKSDFMESFKAWVLSEWSHSLCSTLSQSVCFNLSQKLKDLRDEIRCALSNPTGSFVEALRKAVKLPAMRKTCDPTKFPEDQRVTPDEERFVESLSTVLTQELERLDASNSLQLPHGRKLTSLTYGSWKRCRNLIGSRCLALRKLTGDASKPLLWTTSVGAGGRFNGGGQHYVYLSQSRAHIGGNIESYVKRVLKQKLKKTRNSVTVEQHVRSLIASSPAESWPVSSSNVDAFVHDTAEEMLGEEMAVAIVTERP